MSQPRAKTTEEFEATKALLWKFMKEDIYPNEQLYAEQCKEIGRRSNEWVWPAVLVDLKRKAKRLGLWNMFLPVDSAAAAGTHGALGGGFTNRQYAELCEILGTSAHMEFAAQATNCTSPDTGNMEVLARYGTPAQREQWLVPLLEGSIRSCFAMTEPGVASSDATNIGINITRDERAGQYVINGSKWYITGAGSLHCKIMILMGKTRTDGPVYAQQSQILVPMDTPGITLVRPMESFGETEPPKGHMEIHFRDVRVPFENVLLGEGRGFEISQGRLGPGRIHHCMRLIGSAERGVSHMVRRIHDRTAFGKPLSKFDSVLQELAKSRCEIEMCRLLVYRAAELMDTCGNRDGRTRQMLSMVKAHVPLAVQTILDRCIQIHGAMGLSQDTPLMQAFGGARALRLADGPDEVHWRTAARLELSMQRESPLKDIPYYEKPNTVFRNSTDPISAKSAALVAQYSKL